MSTIIEPEHYYLLRNSKGDVVSAYCSHIKYGNNAMLGVKRLELTTRVFVETLQEFEVIGPISDEPENIWYNFTSDSPKETIHRP